MKAGAFTATDVSGGAEQAPRFAVCEQRCLKEVTDSAAQFA